MRFKIPLGVDPGRPWRGDTDRATFGVDGHLIMCQLQGAVPGQSGTRHDSRREPDRLRSGAPSASGASAPRCSEWNLLGAEAAERALPELAARFAAAPKRAGGEGFAPAHVGSALEILQIGEAVVAVNDAVLRKRRRQLRRSQADRRALLGLVRHGADIRRARDVLLSRGASSSGGVHRRSSLDRSTISRDVGCNRRRQSVPLIGSSSCCLPWHFGGRWLGDC